MPKLQELQEKRQELAAKLRAFHTEHENNWTGEVDTNWKALNADFQTVTDGMAVENKAEQDRLAAEDEAAKRREYVVGLDRVPSNSRIGRDGATLANPNTNLRALALSGWMKNEGRHGRPVTDGERIAAQSLGVDLRADGIELAIGNTGDISRLQNAGAYCGGRYQNALTTQTGSEGGFTVGESFGTALEMALVFSGSMRQHSDIIRTTSGEPFYWPTADDRSNMGAILPENQCATELDPVFARQMWGAYKFSSRMVKVSSEMLTDSLINIPQTLGQMLGERIGRIQNKLFTLGLGGSEPMGLVPSSSLGATTGSATAIVFDEMINLEHSIDPSRRSDAGYTFHDNILLALRKVKDSEGRYLWQAGANTGAPDTLNTWPYFLNSDMASVIEAGAKTVLFGQLGMYKIRDVGSVRLFRLQERFRECDQDAFVAFLRSDGNLLNAGDNPVTHLLQVT